MHVMFDSMEAVDTSLILVGTYIRKKKRHSQSCFAFSHQGSIADDVSTNPGQQQKGFPVIKK